MDKEYYDLKMKCQNELAPHNLATIKYLKYLEKQLKVTNDSKPVVDVRVSLYGMKLHEELCSGGNLRITRVPGGWIYMFWDYEKGNDMPFGVFVPFDNDLQKG